MAESPSKLSPLKRVKKFAGRNSKGGAKDESGNFVRRLSLRVPRKKSAAAREEQLRRRHSDGDDEGTDGALEAKNKPKGRSGLSARGTQRSEAITQGKLENEAEIGRTDSKVERKNLENNNDQINLDKIKKEDEVIKPTGDASLINSSKTTPEKRLEEKNSEMSVTSKMQSPKKSQGVTNDGSHVSDGLKSGSTSTTKAEEQPILNAGVPVTPQKSDIMSNRDDTSIPVNEDNEMAGWGKMKTTLSPSNLKRQFSLRISKTNSSDPTDKVVPISPQSNSSIETKSEQSGFKMASTSKVKEGTNTTDMPTTPATISNSGSTPVKETVEGDSKPSKTKVITETASNLKRRLSKRGLRKGDKMEKSLTVINESIPPSQKSNSSVETGNESTELHTAHPKGLLYVQKTRLDQQKDSLGEKKDEGDTGVSRVRSVSESNADGEKAGSSTTTPKEQWRKVSSFVRSGSKRLSSSIKSKVLTKDRTDSNGKYGSAVIDSVTEEPNVPEDTVKGVTDGVSATKGSQNEVAKDEGSNDAPKPKKPNTLDIAPTDKSQERATHYKLQQDTDRLNKEWVDAQKKLNSFVDNALHSLSDGVDFRKPGEQDSQQDEIMNSHWDDEKQHKTCPGCERSFSVRSKKNLKKKNKPDHCRKCGRVFCKKCLQNTRKLNTFAQYDPFGKEFPVCSECYRPQTAIPTMGSINSHTADFKKYRKSFTIHGRDEEVDIKEFRFSPTPATCIRQSKRLVGGYRRYLQDRDLNPKLDLGNVIKVPEWQKAPTWVDPKSEEGAGCQLCPSGRLDSIHNCRLCGRRVCSQDSNKNFMLYVPDPDTPEYSGDIDPLWKMIQIVGCPDREPAIKLYLRICFNCQEKLINLQEKLYQQMMVTIATDYEKCEKTVLEIHRRTQEMKKTIQTLLPQFSEKVNNLATDPNSIPSGTVKDISKQQDDLMDQFPRYVMAIEKLREMSPQTEQQMKLVKSLILEKLAFYKENLTKFRLSVRQLVELLPNEVMQEIKDMVNRDVINNTYNDLLQLAFETDHISKKYQLSLNLVEALKKAKQVCEGELKPMVLKNNPGNAPEIWNDHKKRQEEYAESKAKSDRRFLQPNESEIEEKREYLPKYIKREALQRVTYFSLQLKAKSSNRSFKNTKMALETLLTECR